MALASNSRAKRNGANASRRSVTPRSLPTEKLSRAGSKVVSTFNEAIEPMRSGDPLEMRFSVRNYKADFDCRAYDPVQRAARTWPARNEPGLLCSVPGC